MRPIWILLSILILIVSFQYQNIAAFIGIELALKGFKELDKNLISADPGGSWSGTGITQVLV